jgi:hypothetical protein
MNCNLIVQFSQQYERVFNMSTISQKLSSLSLAHRAAYAATCCRHVLPILKWQIGSTLLQEKCIDYINKSATGQVVDQAVENDLITQLEQTTPSMNNERGMYAPAIAACVAIRYAFDSLHDDSGESSANCAESALEAVQHLGNFLEKDGSDSEDAWQIFVLGILEQHSDISIFIANEHKFEAIQPEWRNWLEAVK